MRSPLLYFAIACMCSVSLSRIARAEPVTLAVQGRLGAVGGGPVADGAYPLKIALYATKAAPKSA